MRTLVTLAALTLVAPTLFAEAPAAQKKTSRSTSPSASPGSTAPSPPDDASSGTKVVSYTDRDVVSVNTKVRYTTLIILPKTEEILDFACGDQGQWVVNGNANFAYVKPAQEGIKTNLNLVTASGNVYTFALAEVSGTSTVTPDFKVFIELKDPAMQSTAAGPTRFVSVQELEDARRQLSIAHDETQRVKSEKDAAVEAGIQGFITNVRFAYRFEAGKKPFFVRAMYHDDKFTYIQARPEETPTLFELVDGKPALTNFDYHDGVYVVRKILSRGFLVIGKQKLEFAKEE